MAATRFDFRFTQGDIFGHTFNFVDDQVPPEPIDYSGYTFTAQVRPEASSDTVWDFQVNDADIATGTIVLALVAADTLEMPRQCVWDLQVADGVNTLVTLLSGDVIVDRQVTR